MPPKYPAHHAKGKHKDDYLSLRTKRMGGGRNPVKLPDDWKIPETIHNQSYRDPRIFKMSDLHESQQLQTKQDRNVKSWGKEQQMLLQLKTGSSEYADVIGTTGDRILKEQWHGVPLPLDPPSSRLKSPDTIGSECSKLLMARKTSFIPNVF